MIKYLDLQKINASFEPELSDALLRISHSGWYLHGEATARFRSLPIFAARLTASAQETVWMPLLLYSLLTGNSE